MTREEIEELRRAIETTDRLNPGDVSTNADSLSSWYSTARLFMVNRHATLAALELASHGEGVDGVVADCMPWMFDNEDDQGEIVQTEGTNIEIELRVPFSDIRKLMNCRVRIIPIPQPSAETAKERGQ